MSPALQADSLAPGKPLPFHNGKESEKEYIYMYIYESESLCYTSEAL